MDRPKIKTFSRLEVPKRTSTYVMSCCYCGAKTQNKSDSLTSFSYLLFVHTHDQDNSSIINFHSQFPAAKIYYFKKEQKSFSLKIYENNSFSS